MEKSSQGVGRCKFSFWFAVFHDVLGFLILLSGVFWDIFFNDFLIYAGAVVIFLSLIWWVFWYTGNIEVPPAELEDDITLYKRTKGISGVVHKVSDRLSNGMSSFRKSAPKANSRQNGTNCTHICMISYTNTQPLGPSNHLAVAKCPNSYYYDGLLDDCQPCSIRCSRAPPSSCVTYCPSTASSANEAGKNRNMRVIIIVLFVFLGAFITLTLIQVARRKACRPAIKTKAQLQESSESDGSSETTEKSDDGSPDMEDATCKTHCNTSLPLPSTEEGTTMLVTTKTVQTYSCRARYTEDVALGV